MDTSPVSESWDGVGAYFNFADSPSMLTVILLLAVVVTIGGIVISAKYENESAKKHIDDYASRLTVTGAGSGPGISGGRSPSSSVTRAGMRAFSGSRRGR